MNKNPNIILLGAPGAGKGTTAEFLVGKFDLVHISTGDIFRQEIAQKTELGIKISNIVKSGKLVSDDIVSEVVINKIKDISKGILFDGFPRTVTQAESLDKFFKANSKKISVVLFINLTEEEILTRLSLRRTCKNCKMVYNLASKPPRQMNVCNKCGGALILRSDDKPETIKKRLAIFNKQTAPLVDYYKANHKFFEIDGIGLPVEVSERVFKILGSL